MEYLDGETLEEVIQRCGPLPPAEAVRLLHQALCGLQHIHEQGLIHRDLKPANLMLVPASPADPHAALGRATLKILDIGLGRALEDRSAVTVEPALTSDGIPLGTPAYLAPEQARNARGVDIRADIYGLGCVLYHMLTGQPPFLDTSVVHQMERHSTEPPRPLKSFNLGIPDGLQQVVDRMLAKDPAERYPTPEQAAAVLQAFLAPADEALRTPEGDPSMRPYLIWLERQSTERKEASAAETATARRTGKTPPFPARKPQPEAKGPVAPTEPEADYDVELLPLPPEGKPKGADKGFRLSRRDLIMLGSGGAGVLVAGLIGLLLAKHSGGKDAPGTPDRKPGQADKE
jgi:serine/threonine protein kinase